MTPYIGWDILRGSPHILRPGDILHQRSTSFISRNIRRFTEHPGERESFASHTAMVVYADPEVPKGLRGMPTGIQIIESQATIRINPLIKGYANASTDAVITRVPGLTDYDRARLQLRAQNLDGMKYPYAKIGLHALDRLLFHGRYVLRRFAFSGSEYCTALVQRIYHEAGLTLAPYDLDHIDPDSLLDYEIGAGHPLVWASSEKALELVNTIYEKGNEAVQTQPEARYDPGRDQADHRLREV